MPERDPDRPSLVAETISRLYGAGRAAEARALADTALRDGLEPQAAALVRLELAQVLVFSALSEVPRQCRIALEQPGLPENLRLHLRITLTVEIGRAHV